MIFSRNRFILLLLLIITGPVAGYKISWICSAEKTTGKMWFEGHTMETQGISDHPVILFMVNNDSCYFNGNVNIELTPGESVPVLYQKADPAGAKIDRFVCLWSDTIIYLLLPLFVLMVIAFTPERWNPLLPAGCSVQIGKKPFVRIIPRRPW